MEMMQQEYEQALRQLEVKTTSGSFDTRTGDLTVGSLQPLSYKDMDLLRVGESDIYEDSPSMPSHSYQDNTAGDKLPLYKYLTQGAVSQEIARRYEGGDEIESIAEGVTHNYGQAVSGLDIYRAVREMGLTRPAR